MRAAVEAGPAGPHRGADQAVPDAQPHRRGAGRHVRGAGQRRRGQLGVAHLRHRQGRRLPRRPGRRRDHVQGSHRRGARPREDGDAVQPHPRGPHRPAPVRRAHPRPRQGAGAPGLLRRRPHRPHDPADAVPELRQARRRVLQRVLRTRHRADRDPGRARWPPASSPTSWPPATSTSSTPRRSCSPPAARAGCTRPPPTPTRSPATGWASCSARDFRWRTWSFTSSTRPGWPGWAS